MNDRAQNNPSNSVVDDSTNPDLNINSLPLATRPTTPLAGPGSQNNHQRTGMRALINFLMYWLGGSICNGMDDCNEQDLFACLVCSPFV